MLDAEWIVIRRQLRGHNGTSFGKPWPAYRPPGGWLSLGRFWWFQLLLISNTPETRYNKSEGTNDFVLYKGILLLQGLFIIELTTKWLKTKFVIKGIVIARFQCTIF
jgi:hypothetical protein